MMYYHKYSESAPVCLQGAQKIMQLSVSFDIASLTCAVLTSVCHLGICSLLIQQSSGENHVLG